MHEFVDNLAALWPNLQGGAAKGPSTYPAGDQRRRAAGRSETTRDRQAWRAGHHLDDAAQQREPACASGAHGDRLARQPGRPDSELASRVHAFGDRSGTAGAEGSGDIDNRSGRRRAGLLFGPSRGEGPGLPACAHHDRSRRHDGRTRESANPVATAHRRAPQAHAKLVVDGAASRQPDVQPVLARRWSWAGVPAGADWNATCDSLQQHDAGGHQTGRGRRTGKFGRYSPPADPAPPGGRSRRCSPGSTSN